MKKKLAALLAALTLALSLTACSGMPQQPDPLPEGMTQETLLAQGELVVELILNEDYTAVYEQFRDDVQATLTVEALSDLISPTLEKAGEVEKLEESNTLGVSAEEGVEAHGIAQFRYECDKRDLAFSLAFDPDLALIGLNAEVGRGDFKFSNIGKNFADKVDGIFKKD